MLTKQQLIAAASNDVVRDFLTNIAFPDELSIEATIVNLLDTYYNAQTVYNRTAATGQRLNFISDVKVIDSKIVDTQAQSYELKKAMTVNSVVVTEPTSIEPSTL